MRTGTRLLSALWTAPANAYANINLQFVCVPREWSKGAASTYLRPNIHMNQHCSGEPTSLCESLCSTQSNHFVRTGHNLKVRFPIAFGSHSSDFLKKCGMVGPPIHKSMCYAALSRRKVSMRIQESDFANSLVPRREGRSWTL